MEKQKKFRALALFLSVTLLISVLLPSVFADNGDTDASSTDTLIIEEPTLDKVMESDVDVSEYGKYESEDGQPLSDDGEPLSRGCPPHSV